MKITRFLSSIWRSAVDWFERGDLVPLLVLVSAVHYAVVLAGKDRWEVAVAIGLLVDLGHFRTVRAAVRYSVPPGRRRRKGHALLRFLSRYNSQTIVRWLIAAGMTAVSFAYHQRYYGDLWLSIPLPALIAALAWLQHVDRPRKQTAGEAQERREKPQSKTAEPHAAPTPVFTCDICGATQTQDGKPITSQQSLAAHKRSHRRIPVALMPASSMKSAEKTEHGAVIAVDAETWGKVGAESGEET